MTQDGVVQGRLEPWLAEVYESIEEMDESIYQLSNKLESSNPRAMSQLKKVIWEGTESWDELLKERAAISGELVLSQFSKNAIMALKKK